MRKLLAFLFICASFYSKSQAICAGSSATLSAPNPSNLGQPTYTILPGGSQNNSGIFVVTPPVTTTYTLLTRGTYTASTIITTSAVVIVTVNPQPNVAPTVTSANCTSTISGFNLNLTFTPLTPIPSYTVLWGPPIPPPNIPIGILSPQQTSVATGVSPGAYEATITAVGGCQVLVNFTINPPPAPATFSLFPYGNIYTITCIQPTIDVSASNAANSYTWFNTSSLPIVSPTVNLNATNLGTWSVTGQNTISLCVKTLTFQLLQNISTPTSVISPSVVAINCTQAAVPTISVFAQPTLNITHYIYAPQGGTFIANSYTAIYTPGGPGTYTHELMENASGCKTVKLFTITSTSGYPTYSLSSPDNFTLGCTTKSVATLNIVGAATSPTPGGPISYTIIGPPTSTTIPSGTLSAFSTYTINTPGTWTVVVKDNTNQCETRTPISILQNTFPPGIAASASLDLYVLDCTNTVTILQGFSETPNISYNWSFQGTPGNFPGSTVTVVVNKIAPTNTIINNYTLTIKDLSSTCISTTVITMRQNLFVPKVGFALGGPGLTCLTPTVVLTNTSTSGIPANTYPVIYPVIGYMWSGPSPQPTVYISTTYVAGIVGTYTLIGQDLNNGCLGVATGSVDDLRDYPIVNNPTAPPASVLDCGAISTKVYPAITSPTTSLAYLWKAPNIASVSCANCFSLTTNFPGTYTITVTNTLNFCATSSTLAVKNGSLTGAFEPDRDKGYAPLTVTFMNNSFSSNSKDNINSNWGFGNGTSSISVQASINPVSIYSQAGTYSVVLYVNKGACFDTVVKFITAEIPSKLEIPDMFTPNGDGINDLYFLKSTNLTEINFRIIDRWGHLVYELVSSTGNVLWDGKNQTGAEVAEGVYYFTLSATGKDGTTYDEKGTITLLR